MVDQVEFPKIQNNGYYWIGKEYYNTYVEEFTDVANYLEGELNAGLSWVEAQGLSYVDDLDFDRPIVAN